MALLALSLGYFPVLTRYLSPPSMFNEVKLYAQLEILNGKAWTSYHENWITISGDALPALLQ